MAAVAHTIENDAHAHDLLRAGHEGSYRFPAGFHGFAGTAAVTRCAPDGAVTTETGQVLVSGPRATALDGFADDALRTWGAEEIRSMAGHRWPTPYAEADGKHTLTFEALPGNPLGDLINVHDDRFDSAYRVRDGRISQVIRSVGPMRFTITMLRHHEVSGGKTLPELFTVTYWKDGRLTRSDMYTDTYREVDGVWIPAGRKVVTATDDGFVTHALEISDVTLLDEPVESESGAEERTVTRAG